MYVTPIFWILLLLLRVFHPLSVRFSSVPETKAASSTQSLFFLHKEKSKGLQISQETSLLCNLGICRKVFETIAQGKEEQDFSLLTIPSECQAGLEMCFHPGLSNMQNYHLVEQNNDE